MTLYNTLRLFYVHYLEDNPDFNTHYVNELFYKRYEQCMRTLNCYDELFPSDPIFKKIKQKYYFSLGLYLGLFDIIIKDKHKYEKRIEKIMDDVLDT